MSMDRQTDGRAHLLIGVSKNKQINGLKDIQ